MTASVDVRDAFRIYPSPGRATVALQGLTLSVAPGEIVAVLGPSGSGKTTLLRAIAGFEPLSAGSVHVLGTDLGRLGPRSTAAFRAAHLGFLDQHYALTLSPDLSCLDTVALQLELGGTGRREARERARDVLRRVGLADRADDRPETLSGGEQQRVAVCAAIAHAPRLLLADEPAGELDPAGAATVYGLLGEIVREAGAAAVIVTHDAIAASVADRLVHIRDGRLVEQSTNGDPPSLVVSRTGWVRLPERLLQASLVSAERVDDRVVLRPLGRKRDQPAELRAPEPVARDPQSKIVAEVREVSKRFGRRSVLAGLSHAFVGGRLSAVVGRSGSGKTTLLHLLAGLERPDAGDVVVGGELLGSKPRAELAALRRRSVALVTQEPGLVPYLSARENVQLTLAVRNAAERATPRAEAALVEVGLGERLDQRVSSLSAGERQRVAIARALAAEVSLLLVDEPTARLDEENGRAAGELLARAAADRGIAVVCATHDPVLIELAGDVLPLASS